jgi:aspartate-semialdehyde dehydrogenase
MELVVIGYNGLVGKEFINLCIEKKQDFIIIGNSDKNTFVNINDIEYWCHDLDTFNFSKDYIFVNCADKYQALFVSEHMSSNSILIDNSSQFRMTKDVPLVVPEINFPIDKHRIYANPNCSTIILSLLLAPLQKYGLKRVVVSTYQASSGAGKLGLDELVKQTKEISVAEELTKDFWGKQYVFNTFVHNTPIDSLTFYNEEEMKIINETKKIFNQDIPLTATCIRVPVIRSHCESVNVELESDIDYKHIIDTLKLYPYIEIIDDKINQIFPETITSSNKTVIQVGHIRKDLSIKNGWNFWISGDQILRGASYNAFLIYEKIKKYKN